MGPSRHDHWEHGPWGYDGPVHHGHLPEPWLLLGALGLLALLVAAAWLLARRTDLPARLAEALGNLRRPAGPPAAAAPTGVDLRVLGHHPAPVREAFARAVAVTDELQALLDARGRLDDSLHEHRLQGLRQALAELAATLGRLPLDVALAAQPGSRSAMAEAVDTLRLLDGEAHRLRRDVHADSVANLQQQRRFAEDKYGRRPSLLDLP